MSEQRFTERYREVIERATGIVEERARYRGVLIRERVVRCIWAGQYLACGSLRTLDGESLRVITPGWWNTESGPDFLKAEILFGEGPIQRGDVEIHLHASEWYRHEHHRDSRYNQVLLHVVLWNDRDDDFVVNQKGEPVRQLVVEENLDRDLGELIDLLSHEDFPLPVSPTAGLCHRYLKEKRVSEDWVVSFLEHAGDERVLRKARALARRGREVGEDQAFYESMLGAFGFKNNKEAMEKLARNAPLSALNPLFGQGALALQAYLFGASGLLPQEMLLPDLPDAETSKLVESYRKILRVGEGSSSLPRMGLGDWNFSGTRPVNFPTRRIAAASHWLAGNLREGLVNSALEAIPKEFLAGGREMEAPAVRRICRALQQRFFSAKDDYWSYRCNFGGRPSSRPMQLVGSERLAVIMINVIVPALLARALSRRDLALESLLHQVYDRFPPLAETNITRFMVARVFGGDSNAEKLLVTARRQQGLYQLYSDFERDDRSCENCAFAKAMLL